ncbi:MAG: hypothetical protein ACRDSH_12355 [Pseudonocardiaceae bacterium]
MSTDALTRATENVMQAAHLSPEAADELRAAANSPTLLPAGGYHSSAEIDSLTGLPGSYLWSEDLLNVRVITFAFSPGKVGSEGVYTIKSGTVLFEEGIFQSVPSGQSSPVALLFLQPSGGPQRIFIIAGAFIDQTE